MEQRLTPLERSRKQHKAQYTKYESLFDADFIKSKSFKEERAIQGLQILAKYRGQRGNNDWITRRVMRLEQRNLEREIYGSWMGRQLYRGVNELKVVWRNRQLDKAADKNMLQVTGELRKMGLPLVIDEVKERMRKGEALIEVPLSYQLSENTRMSVALQVKKDEQGLYQVDNFKATLQMGDEKRTHVFKKASGQPLNLQQAQNLMLGRAVKTEYLVEGQKHQVWMQLDLNDKQGESFTMKRFEKNYGYDLDKEFDKLKPAATLTAEQRASLIQDLEQGKKVPLTINQDNVEKTFYLQANPGKRTIDLINNSGKVEKRDPAVIRKMDNAVKNDQANEEKRKVRVLRA